MVVMWFGLFINELFVVIIFFIIWIFFLVCIYFLVNVINVLLVLNLGGIFGIWLYL